MSEREYDPYYDDKVVTVETVPPDEDGFGFVVRWECSRIWADFKVYEPESVGDGKDGADTKYFTNTRHTNAKWAQTDDIDKAEVYVSGYVKSDGCSHLATEGIHLCGASHWKRFRGLLNYLYPRAFELMDRDMEDRDEWEAGG